ncbi:hypothetical protein DVDV_0703 [Desulfovibrio sp. DV]|nr:hypothetical protein DVDV_0703 [Desulfovibrio sp. DV]
MRRSGACVGCAGRARVFWLKLSRWREHTNGAKAGRMAQTWHFCIVPGSCLRPGNLGGNAGRG